MKELYIYNKLHNTIGIYPIKKESKLTITIYYHKGNILTDDSIGYCYKERFLKAEINSLSTYNNDYYLATDLKTLKVMILEHLEKQFKQYKKNIEILEASE